MLFANFIAAVNYALQHKKIMFNYPNSSNVMFIILNLLIVEGLIAAYSTYTVMPQDVKNFFFFGRQKTLRSGIFVLLHLKKGRYGVLRNAAVISTPGWFKFVSYYKLRSIIFKSPSSVFLLSVASFGGYVTAASANRLRSGGKLILKLN